MSEFARLLTCEVESLQGQPWNCYPRPQLRRESFFCLNGEWEFSVTEDGKAPKEYDRKIRVPFAPESILSGVEEVFPEENTLWYRREFTLPEGFWKDLETSLKNLRTNYIDIYQLHMVSQCYRPGDGTGMYECL